MSNIPATGIYRLCRPAALALASALILAVLAGCPLRLVQPYDQKLFDSTEAIYKQGLEMIAEGIASNTSTYDQFEAKYDKLILETDILLMRALSANQALDAAGQKIQAKVNELIDTTIPSLCPDLKSELSPVSLTAANYADLKCLLLKWKEDHRKKVDLKPATWEGRRRTLTQLILAIQKAEYFKKEKKK